jgi:hypothetical protein
LYTHILIFKHLFAFWASGFYGTMAAAAISNNMLLCAGPGTGKSVRAGSGRLIFLPQIQIEREGFFAGVTVCQDLIRRSDQLPVRALYCAFVRGTTESLP